VTVGDTPLGLAIDGATGYLFVVNIASNNVTVINTSTDQVVTSVLVGSGPQGVAVDPVNDHVFVTDRYGGGMSVLNGSTLKVIDSFTFGSKPEAVAYDDATGDLFVTNNGATDATIISGKTDKVVGGVAVENNPAGVVYDRSNGYVYIANTGSDDLTVVNGTSDAVIGSIHTGVNPENLAVDPSNGYVYVANLGSSNVTVINGSTDKVVGAIAVGLGPVSVAYDNASGELYVTNGNQASLSVINATSDSVVGTLNVGEGPWGVTTDPANGCVYVTDSGSGSISIIAPRLEAIARAMPNATDVGLPVSFVATATAGLPPYESYAWSFGDGTTANETVNATPHTYETSGRYVANVVATDGGGFTASANATATVNALPVVAMPQASAASADVGQMVVVRATASLGTEPYGSYSWTGLPVGCTGVTTANATCTVTAAGAYSITVKVTDSIGGQSAPSPPLSFRVFAAPTTAVPLANRSSADVDQPVAFSAVLTGGTGSFVSFAWSGLTGANCTGRSTADPTCRFPEPGSVEVDVVATDSNGVSSPASPSISLQVSPLPSVTRITTDRPVADIGQSVRFSAVASGGFGAYAYEWWGLPSSGCVGLLTDAVVCEVQTPGIITASVVITDANNGSSGPGPSARTTVSSDPAVSPLDLSSSSVRVGQRVFVNSTVTGGAGNDTYNWSGLPTGCTAVGALATCEPEQAGVYRITLAVTDGAGYSVTSLPSNLTVSAPPSGGSPSPFAGLPPAAAYGAVGAVLVVVAVALLLTRKRARSRHGRPPPAAAPSTASERSEDR
jgi:YVTN family beta-propeller protein